VSQNWWLIRVMNVPDKSIKNPILYTNKE
jgi:hypothetical protein